MKSLVPFFLLIGLAFSMSVQAFELVTREEYLESLALERIVPSFIPKLMPTATDLVIDVRSPSLVSPVKAPVTFDLRCHSPGSSSINWASLKIFYRIGLLKKDITERVKKEAKVLGDGIQIASADIPSGSHRIIIQITSTEGKQTEREVEFTVE
jgi:hypothetical protein